MNMIKAMKNVKLSKVEALTGLSTFQKNEEGYGLFLDRVKELFSSRDEETKAKLREIGGYRGVFDTADLYFESDSSTVNEVTTRFFLLTDRMVKEVRGDSNNYRAKLRSRYSEEWNSFAYPGDFLSAYRIVSENYQLTEDLLRSPKVTK